MTRYPHTPRADAFMSACFAIAGLAAAAGLVITVIAGA